MKGALRVLALILICFVAGIWGLRPQKPQSTSNQRGPSGSSAGNAASAQAAGPIIGQAVAVGVSPAVRDLPPSEPSATELNREINPRQNPNSLLQGNIPHVDEGPDPLIPYSLNGGDTPPLDFSFDGTSNPTGCGGCSPPDINGDVGPNHYIHAVNATKMAIYDKSGTLLEPAFDLGDLWSSGNCTDNAGDPVVLYDPLADRWLLSQFASPNHMCIAISQTADPTGSYHLYTFDVGDFPDYFKFGVWPDGYYMSANEGSYTAYAFDRAKMLVGDVSASFVKFTGEDNFLLPSDIDGTTLPPAGAPGYFFTFKDDSFHGNGADRVELFALDVNWATPGSSTFDLIETFNVPTFTYTPCGFFNFNCIHQLGTTQRFDALGEWPMFRFPYRNFGDHQALVGTYSVGGGSGEEGSAIRWFELRNSGADWSVFQEGTFDPGDGHDRMNSSIAIDKAGNIAMGYTVSSSTMNPSIRYTVRYAGDPLGTMRDEEVLINGGGSQTGSNRWGDYSAIAVDPANDCSFWYTNEYYSANSASNWKTRVGVFTIPGCLVPDFILSADPVEQNICAGSNAIYDVNVGASSGFSDNVTLSAVNNPAGTTTNFSTNPVTPPGSSVLTIGNTGAVAAGNYAIDIVGVAPTSTHTTTVGLNVFNGNPAVPTLLTPANGATGQPTEPSFSWSAASQAVSYTIQIATDAGFTNIVDSATVNGTSYTPAAPLGVAATYYWRVRANNPCGSGNFSAVFNFTTSICPAPNLAIPDDDPTGVTADLVLSGSGAIDDLDVSIVVEHTYVGDLQFDLTHVDTGTTVTFVDRPGYTGSGFGCSGDDIDATLSDEADDPVEDECGAGTPTIDGTFSPNNALSAFDGEDVGGTWRITAADHAGQDTGTLIEWCVLPTFTPVVEPGVATSGNQSDSGEVGTDVVYTIVVTNTGNITDTFNVSLTGNAWTTVVDDNTIGPLAPGASGIATVTVTVGAGVSDSVTVTFTSTVDPNVTAEAILTTTAVEVGTEFILNLPIVVYNE